MSGGKQLQNGSKYAQHDIDGNGIVSDAELDRSERMIQIENMDKMADQQRVMAWAALILPLVILLILVVPYVSVEKVNAVMGIVTTYVAAMGTIVVAFMAATAYVRGKMD